MPVSRARGATGRVRAPLLGRGPQAHARREGAPVLDDAPVTDTSLGTERPWLVVVWNDPINLMTYVTYVFQKLFGFSRDKATRLMLDVHRKGRAVVTSGPRERAELDVARLHGHGLSATLERGE